MMMAMARKAGKTAAFVAAVACAVIALVAVRVPSARAAAPQTIATAAQFELFAQAVNSGGESYAGKTVTLACDLTLKSLAGFQPIGTREHPFLGTFDGGENTISDLTLSRTGADAPFSGLFGYVGPGGCIKNLTLVDCHIVVASATDVICNVGSIAGYVHGVIGEDSYAIDNCYSDAKVTVTSTMKTGGAKTSVPAAPDAALASGQTDTCCTVERIGGIVGYCAGSIRNAEFEGEVSITSHEACDGGNSTLGHAFGGIAGQAGGYLVEHPDGSANGPTFEPVYPTADGTGAQNGQVSVVESCVNRGRVHVCMDAESGEDRFGQGTSAKSAAVGGIVGYAMCNVDLCVNEGKLDSSQSTTTGADGCGGIVGSLRMFPATSLEGTAMRFASDPGCYKPTGADESERMAGPVLGVSKCVNRGQVVALHDGGGIVGGAGSYTLVTQCANEKKGKVAGVRWNKPTCGGIAGDTYGDVTFCYNRADVASKVDGSGGGYYCAGIVGALRKFALPEGKYAPGDDLNSPVPQIYSCYSTGSILVGGVGYRNAGICGESEGFIHDCLFLKSGVKHSGSDNPAVAKDYGTVADTVEPLEDESEDVSASDKLKTKAYVAKLNAPASFTDYENGVHYVCAGSDANSGYAMLAWQREDAGAAFDETALAARADAEALYSAVENPMPKLDISYNGTALVQGADYYAVPDAAAAGPDGACKNVADDPGTLAATITGIGDYAGTTTWSAPYKLAKSPFALCTVWIKSKTFDWTALYPAEPTDEEDSEVIITDQAGNRVPADGFEMAPDAGACVHRVVSMTGADGKTHSGYPITFTAKDNSNYTGAVTGYFQIRPADLVDAQTVRIESISFNGRTWRYKLGEVTGIARAEGYAYRVVDGKEVRGMQIPYTGQAIKPTLDKVVFTGGDGAEHVLKQGEAFRLVYGDPGATGEVLVNEPAGANIAVTDGTPGNRACITFRYILGSTTPACDFDDYLNIFFDIVPANLADSAQTSVSVESTASGFPVTVKGATGATITPANYSVSLSAASAGKVRVTVKGKGNLTGAYSTVVADRRAKEVVINKASVTGKVVKAALKKANNAGAKQVTLGPKVKRIAKGAFAGTKVTTLLVKTKKLKKGKVKGALLKSKVKTVLVKIGSKKKSKTWVKKYSKVLTKRIVGKKVKLKVA